MPTGDHRLDQFESLFKSAVKKVFHYAPPDVERVLVVTDLPPAEARELTVKVQGFLATIDEAHRLQWQTVSSEDWSEITQVPGMLAERRPDLVVTYRHLLGGIKNLPYTLGSVVDTLTQVAGVPVLLLPPPTRPDFDALLRGTHRVLVVTDHLTGDDRLVNWGVHFTHADGTLYLAHVEDDAVLKRYLEVIGQIRQLSTEDAEEELPRKLLQLPAEYIESIARELAEHGVRETVVPEVRMGHALRDYKQLMGEHDIDLLLLSTQDADQEAMSALGHALAVEIRHRPLLLL